MPRRPSSSRFSGPRGAVAMSAGEHHIILSRSLLFILSFMIILAGCLFFAVEQRNIHIIRRGTARAVAANAKLSDSNELLERHRRELYSEKDSLMTKYNMFLSNDNGVSDTAEALQEVKGNLDDLKKAMEKHSSDLTAKEKLLESKEKRLRSYQFKIQQKQKFLDELGDILSKIEKDATPLEDGDQVPLRANKKSGAEDDDWSDDKQKGQDRGKGFRQISQQFFDKDNLEDDDDVPSGDDDDIDDDDEKWY